MIDYILCHERKRGFYVDPVDCIQIRGKRAFIHKHISRWRCVSWIVSDQPSGIKLGAYSTKKEALSAVAELCSRRDAALSKGENRHIFDEHGKSMTITYARACELKMDLVSALSGAAGQQCQTGEEEKS